MMNIKGSSKLHYTTKIYSYVYLPPLQLEMRLKMIDGIVFYILYQECNNKLVDMSQVDHRLTKEMGVEKVFERFPFTVFSGIQSFILYQNFTDFLGGVVEFPLALVQYPYYLFSGQRFAFPSRNSQMQSLINLGRYRSIHSDVI